MIAWGLRELHDRVFFPARNKALVTRLSPAFQDCASVLDLGASDGRLAKAMSEFVSAEFTGCDVHLQPKPFIPVYKYDGIHLPFEDNAFDCVMLIDVLHHSDNAQEVLLEAKRVAKKYIFVKDHIWLTRLGFWNLAMQDYIANKPYGIPVPFNFLQEDQWKSLFDRIGCTLLSYERFRLHAADTLHHFSAKLSVGKQTQASAN